MHLAAAWRLLTSKYHSGKTAAKRKKEFGPLSFFMKKHGIGTREKEKKERHLTEKIP
jgi:hypothetical protein